MSEYADYVRSIKLSELLQEWEALEQDWAKSRFVQSMDDDPDFNDMIEVVKDRIDEVFPLPGGMT